VFSKEGNRITKSIGSPIGIPVLEYGAACCDPCREGLINALDLVQTKAVQFTNHTKDSDWETLAQRRTIARLCALFKGYFGERAWKAIRDRLRRPYYLSMVDHIQENKGQEAKNGYREVFLCQ